ncbi:MAG TPA: lantibiotic immunity ABC transporter MutE/EpiE family permease subunit [Mobilitalea sp.]|nr:lantibiotic immunity ABC transporter MutE/EpiE family permease subunit [Mobilitalea sp.]
MVNFLKAEFLKQKHSFNNVIVWLIPVINILISFVLTGPTYIQTASYNWWYILFLPFVLTYISSSIIKKDCKFNLHGLFGIVKNKKQLWYAKIGTATIYLFLTCFIFSLFTSICGFVFQRQIPVFDNILAGILLFITFAWQIPLFMFIALKVNVFLSIMVSVICNSLIGCVYGVGSYWWIPFAIPARLMCPIIKVLPNGLIMSADNPLKHNNVILPGIVITVALYLVGSYMTAKFFENQEV